MTMAKWDAVSATPEKRIYRNGEIQLTAIRRENGHWYLPDEIGGASVSSANDVYVVVEAYGRLLAEVLELRKLKPPAPIDRLLAEHQDREWLRSSRDGEAICVHRYRDGEWQYRRPGDKSFSLCGVKEPGCSGTVVFTEYVPETVEVLGDSHRDRKWKSADGDVIFFWGKNNFATSKNWKWTRPEIGEMDCYATMALYAKEFGPFTEYWD